VFSQSVRSDCIRGVLRAGEVMEVLSTVGAIQDRSRQVGGKEFAQRGLKLGDTRSLEAGASQN